MRIEIQSREPSDMRYETIGDWYYLSDPDHTLCIDVDNTIPEHEQFLVSLHELVECYLCRVRGISQEAVDKFDFNHPNDGPEPGDSEVAPYRKEHRFAMIIEHMVAHELGIQGYGVIR